MPRGLSLTFLLLAVCFCHERAEGQTPSPAPATAQETALLLGIRYQEAIPKPLPFYQTAADSLARARYRTFLFVRGTDGRIELTAVSPGLVVPRRSGLWSVDARRSVYNNWVEDFLASAPLGARADRAGIQTYNGEYCDGHRVQVVQFAGPSYLGLEQRSAGYCEDAAHPWFTNTLAVVPIDSTTHLGLRITEVLGRAGEVALESGIDRYVSGLRTQQERALYSGRQDNANWGLVRSNGQWSMRGRLESDELATARFANFVLPMKPPASLVGHDELSPSWEKVRDFAPDALDAVSSPQRDWIVILHPVRLTVHPLRRDASIGAMTIDLPLPPGAVFVLNQWTSLNARTWSQTLRTRSTQASVGWRPARP